MAAQWIEHAVSRLCEVRPLAVVVAGYVTLVGENGDRIEIKGGDMSKLVGALQQTSLILQLDMLQKSHEV